MEPDAPQRRIYREGIHRIHVRVRGKSRTHHDKGSTRDDRRRQTHHERDEKRVHESRHLAQGLHVPQFVRLDAQAFHGEIVVQRKLHSEKHAHGKHRRTQ